MIELINQRLQKLYADLKPLQECLGIAMVNCNWASVDSLITSLRDVESKIDVLLALAAEYREDEINEPSVPIVSRCSDCNCGKAEGCGT